MSRYDYLLSQKLGQDDPSFAALIMAAMRKADDRNIEILKAGWPEIWEELYARYWAPGEFIPGDLPEDKHER